MREEHDSYLKLLLDAASSCNMMLNESKSQLRVRTLDILGYRVSFQQVKPDPQRLQSLLDLPPLRTPKELKRVSGMFSYYAKWIPRFSKTADPLLRPAKLSLDGESACLTTIQNGVPFEVETDASDYAIAAILSQGGRLSHLCLVHYILARNITLLSRKKPPPSSKPFGVGHISWKADTSRSSLIRERSRLCSTNVIEARLRIPKSSLKESSWVVFPLLFSPMWKMRLVMTR